MNTTTAVFLGFIQGLTEFLPVSSSGHLVLAQKILGVSGASLALDTMLHLGTLAAVMVVLRRDILELLRRPFQRLTLLLAAATLPVVLVGFIFEDTIEAAFRSGETLGWSFLATAAVLLVSEKISARGGTVKTEKDATTVDALIVGAFQGFAIFPAVSRSGLTIAGSLFRGFDRGFAARFSFLLSIPAILGAVVFQARDIFGGESARGGLTIPILAGTLTAAVVGFFAVSFMLKLVREKSLKGFVVYLVALGALVLSDQYIFHIFF